MNTTTAVRSDAAPDIVLELAGTPPIDGLRFRRLRPGDPDEYAAMAGLARDANRADGIPWLPTADHMRDELEGSPGIVLATDVVLAEIDGGLVGDAVVERVIRDERPVFELFGNVHPAARRRGLGRALLRENLRRARERAAAEPDPGPIVAQSSVEESEVGHIALLHEHGFQIARWYFLMRRPTLDDIPDAPLPDGLEIRPVTPDQHRAIFDAETEAFRDHWGHREMTDEDFAMLFGKAELDTDLWVVAWAGNEIAGIVQNWIWTEENAGLGVARGWNERISVRRPWRRRGLARALTAESLRRLRDAGMTEAMLGVDADNPNGALGLYESLDYEVDQRSMAYRLTIRD